MNNNKTDLLQQFRDGTIQPERAGNYWDPKEREALQQYYYAGTGISEIALLLNRGEMAVIQQLMAAELLTSPGQRRHRAPKPYTCLCAKCFLREGCPKTEEGCARVG